MILKHAPTTAGEAVKICWERCTTAYKYCKQKPETSVQIADFIDGHFELIKYGTMRPTAPVPYHLYPSTRTPLRISLAAKWCHAVRAALFPTNIDCTLDANVKVLRKGAAAPQSIRYICSQMQRACSANSTDPAAPLLRDIMLGANLGIWRNRPPVNPKMRYELWSGDQEIIFGKVMASFKSTDFHHTIAEFAQGVCKTDPELAYVARHANIKTYSTVHTLALLRRIIPKSAHVAKRKAPIGIGIPRVSLSKDAADLLDKETRVTKDGQSSAKRLKMILGASIHQDEIAVAVHRKFVNSYKIAFAPLTVESTAKQMKMPSVTAIYCTGCAKWQTKVAGLEKRGGSVVIDLDESRISCGSCKKFCLVSIGINGVQIRYDHSTWASLCGMCGKFTTDLKLYQTDQICSKCYKSVKNTVSGRCDHVDCTAVAVLHALIERGGQYALGSFCIKHPPTQLPF